MSVWLEMARVVLLDFSSSALRRTACAMRFVPSRVRSVLREICNALACCFQRFPSFVFGAALADASVPDVSSASRARFAHPARCEAVFFSSLLGDAALLRFASSSEMFCSGIGEGACALLRAVAVHGELRLQRLARTPFLRA